MFVENLLLPRFLILELVLVCHYFHYTKACNSINLASVEGMFSGGVEEEEGGSCYIDPGSWTHKPLLISKQRSWLWAGEDGRVAVRSGEEVTLSCPGSRSTCSRVSSTTLACTDATFHDTNNQTQVEVCGCSGDPVDGEQRTGQSCGPADSAGELVQVGFSVESSFHPILDICHDVGTENTFFTRHTLHGGSLKHKHVDNSRPSFKEGKLFFKSISANRSYKKRNQKSLFSRLVGETRSGEIFSDNYLARGHLTPDADFVLKGWQDSTYYYGNVAPQWQSINNGNWRRLENSVRDKAELAAGDLKVVTGTLRVMLLDGDEVWLETKEDKTYIPVPEYFFKIITEEDTRSSLAVVCTNNPQLYRVARSTILCTDICDQSGWGQNFQDRRKIEEGVVFCCSPEEFSALVPWAGPSDLREHALLSF